MSPEQIGSVIAAHLATPDISLDRHMRSRQIELGDSLACRKAIYLDLRFWILLRDVVRFGAHGPEAVLLAGLRQAVASGAAFCPMTDSTFFEVFKQTDDASRLATAELIDELSLGMTLIPLDLRVGTEIAHYVYAARAPESVYALEELVWSKLSYVLGFLHPTSRAFDAATNLALQKAFFDHMWETVSLAQMCTQLGPGFVRKDPLRFRETTSRVNEQIRAHAGDLTSFKQAYEHELVGVLDLYAERLASILPTMLPPEAGPPPPPGSAERAKVDRECLSFLIAAFRIEAGKKAMRSVHIETLLHAAVRWNKGQALKPNDLFDFHHVSAAVGYCDAFFTEGPLRSLVTRPDLGLNDMFRCFVTSDLKEANRYVAQLL